MPSIIIATLVAFITTFILTPAVAERMFRAGFKGRDLHKEERREIPEQGGIAVVAGFFSGLIVYTILEGPAKEIIVTTAVALAVAGIGFFDRIKRLSAREKAVSLTLAGVPLLFIAEPTFLGVNFGILYYLSLPVLFMFTCNFTNMLAGLNGLEIGVGTIASLGVAALAYLRDEKISLALALILAFSLLAFLRYNFYPARVFPGDVGTLFIGAVLFSAIIIGKFELTGAIVLLPYVVDALLKLISAGVMVRESQKPTLVREGKLYAPRDSNLSLVRLFLRIKPMSERQVVLIIYAVALFFASAGVIVETFI